MATTLIGGAIAGIMAHNKEDEPPMEMEEPVETTSVTARDFEGYYTCADTSVAFTITPLDDTRATIILEDISPNDAQPFSKEGTAVIDGEMLIMDLETQEGDRATFALSKNRVIAQASRRYQSNVNRRISGTYALGKKEAVAKTADIKDYIGTFMNGEDSGAGRLTISEIDSQSVNVRFEASRAFGAENGVSIIFENIGHPFENGIYVDVSGQRIEFTKGTQRNGAQGYVLDVPEPLKQHWDILESVYEMEYFLEEELREYIYGGMDSAPPETSEIDRFLGFYAKNYGEYYEGLKLSISDISATAGNLRSEVGSNRHGGWWIGNYTDYSIAGNELKATRYGGTDTFILNDDGSITATFADIPYDNGTYEVMDESVFNLTD